MVPVHSLARVCVRPQWLSVDRLRKGCNERRKRVTRLRRELQHALRVRVPSRLKSHFVIRRGGGAGVEAAEGEYEVADEDRRYSAGAMTH